MENGVKTGSHDVCPQFERIFWSLIEEPEECSLCEYYDEDSGCCRREK